MAKNNFWLLTLCALILIVGATGWNPALRIAAAANSVVVLLEVARKVVDLYKANKGI